MKNTLLLLMIILAVLAANAQPKQGIDHLKTTTGEGHFDWVRSYFGPDYPDGGAPANEIFGSVLDSKGNVYILDHLCILPCGHRPARHAAETKHLRGIADSWSFIDRQNSAFRPLQ